MSAKTRHSYEFESFRLDAMNYAELGRAEEAMTALENSFAGHEQRMMWVRVEPRFANLKHEPRFWQILGKMCLN